MTILYAEDNPSIKQLIEFIFQELEMKFISVNDGSELMNSYMTMLSHDSRPDLIFTDNNMPRLKGIDACRHIDQYEKDIYGSRQTPLVIYTGDIGLINDYKENHSKFIFLDDLIAKPVDIITIETVVSKYGKGN